MSTDHNPFQIGDIVRSSNHHELVHEWKDRTGIVVNIVSRERVAMNVYNPHYGNYRLGVRMNTKYLDLEYDPERIKSAVIMEELHGTSQLP